MLSLLHAATLADVVLVEADGSRRQPLKCFGPHEPVIPPRTDCIVHVAGLSALGRPLDEICFRWEQSRWERRQAVTDEVFAAVVRSCLAYLRRSWTVPVIPVFNQADEEAARLRGQALLRRLAEPIGLTTFFDIGGTGGYTVHIALIYMASGFSRRFGGNKLLAPLAGKPPVSPWL